MTLDISKEDVNCEGGADGTITVNVTGGVAPYTYDWSHDDLENNNVLAGLTAGDYFLTVTDNNDNNDITLIKLTEPTALLASAELEDISCNGNDDGSIVLLVSGGVYPYTYLWSNAITDSIQNNLSSGSYTVTLTDDNGCSLVRTYGISEPDELSLTFNKTDVSGSGLSNGAIDITPSGGKLPYTYAWSNGITTQDLNNLPKGDYTIVITDANNCLVSQTISITEPGALQVDVTKEDIDCFGNDNGSITLAALGGVTAYSFSWAHDAAEQGSSLNDLPKGDYEVTVSDANANQVIKQITIDAPNELSIDAILVHNDCSGDQAGSIATMASGGTMPYTYDWSTGATLATINQLSGGAYDLTLTDANGCNQIINYVVDEPTVLSITYTNEDVSGAGGFDGAIDITVAGGTPTYAYLWSGGEVSEDLNNLMAGTYTVTVTDAKDCVINESITINEPGALAVDAIAQNISCNGAADGAINVTVNGGIEPYTFLWEDGITVEDRANLTAGTYQLTVSDNNGITKVVTRKIIEPESLIIDGAVTDISCNGVSDGAIDIDVTGGTQQYTYNWSTGAQIRNINNLLKGDYTLTVTDANNCFTSKTFSVIEPNELKVTFVKQDVSGFSMADGAIDLTVSGGTQQYTYNWSNGQINEDIENLTVGAYGVTVTDNNGCMESLEITIDEPNALMVTGTKMDLNCFGDANGSIMLKVSGGVAPYTYNWDSGQTDKDLTGLISGSYIVTVIDANGVTKTFSTTIDAPDEIAINGVVTDLACADDGNGSIDVSVSGGTGAYTYAWSILETSEDLNDLSGGVYELTVTDASGCTATKSFSVVEPIELNAMANLTHTSCGGGFTGTIDLTVSGGSGAYSFEWSTGQLSEDLNSLASGDYEITITDENGCQFTDTYIINASGSLALELEAMDINCFGQRDGSITPIYSGGSGSYQFEWSDGSTEENRIGLTKGTYGLTITDASGCSAQFLATIQEPAPMIVNAQTSLAGCRNPNDGAIQLTLSGGHPDYMFSWSNGAITKDLQNLSAGNYTVTITDGNSCEIIESFDVEASEETFDPYFLAATPVAANADIQFIDVSFPKPLTWSWKFGDPQNSFSEIANPIFAYPNDETVDQSTYMAQLSVSNLVCTDSIVKPIQINNLRSSGPVSNSGTRPEYVQVKTVKLYPNPTAEYTLVDVLVNQEADIRIRLFDSKGNLLEELSRDGSNHYQILMDISHYESGTYLINVQAGKHHRTKKLIKIEME